MVDRVINYPGAIPPIEDILNTNKNGMLGLGMALQAILGTTTLADGLACSPTTPAGMTVNVAGGSIYSLAQVDASSYGTLSADTTDQIVKQGIVLGTTNLSCPAPATAGYSVIYLIQAAFDEVDGGSTVLPYYNASNPSVPYSGPSNSGAAQNTVRQGKCILNLKTGAAASSPATPTPDAGYVGLWAVTVANGETTITSGNIAQYPGAPFIGTKLTGLAPIASPTFTGAPKAPTPGYGDNTTALATTAFVQDAFSSQLLSFSGYQVLPGGLILQWMQVSLTTSGTAANGFYGAQDTFSFPMTFPNACLLCVAAPINTAGVEGGAAISNPSTSNLGVAVQNTLAGPSPANVIAIGY